MGNAGLMVADLSFPTQAHAQEEQSEEVTYKLLLVAIAGCQ
jgi:hypothetical protein